MIILASGQCGNQLANSIFNNLIKYSEEKNKYFFNYESKGVKRAKVVCLDTEPKVINSCLQATKRYKQWYYDERCMLYRHGGAGNNWALGYKMFSGEFLESTIDAVRLQLEKSLTPNSFLSIHSIGGGTGSGLGSKLSEIVSEEFPDVYNINVAIAPYSFSEVVVQYYNTLLCLSHLSEYSDAILIYENEMAYNLCKSMRSIEKPLLNDINAVIVKSITPILLPKYNFDTSSSHHFLCTRKRVTLLSDDLIHLCSHPYYKFCTVYNSPLTSEASIDYTLDTWTTLIRTIGNMQSYGTQSERGCSSFSTQKHLQVIGSVLTLRGEDIPLAETISKIMYKDLNMNGSGPYNLHRCASWLDNPIQTRYSEKKVNDYQRSISAICNSQAILPLLERTHTKARLLFEVGAYLHQYSTYGIEEEDFVSAFQNVGQIITNYTHL